MTSFIRYIKDRAGLELDLALWRRAIRSRSRFPNRSCRTVLFCDLVSSLVSFKVQSLFGLALRPHGFRPLSLVSRHNNLATRVYDSAQPTTQIILEDYVDEILRKTSRDRAVDLLVGENALERLLDLEIDNVRIGRNVLSLVLRRLRVGRLDSSNTEHRRLAEEILIDSLVAKEAGRRVLEDVHPDLVLFNERGYTPAGELFDLCLNDGVDAIQWAGAPQSDRMLFKRYKSTNRTMHPLALDDATWQEVETLPWGEAEENDLMERLASHYASDAWFNRQQLQTGKLHKSVDDVRAQLGFAPGRKLAAVFCHILYDATFFYGDSLFRDYEEWLVETVRAAIANPALDWVIKVHPVNVWRSKMDGAPMEQLEARALRHTFGDLPPHVRIMPADTDINSWSLFHAIDYGLTVRGTVGMELPCLAVPVVTAGTGRYSGHGFTIDPKDREEFTQILATLHQRERLDADTVSRARRYAHATFFRRPIPMHSYRVDFNINTYGSTLLSSNVSLLEHPEQAEDLRKLADWMAFGANADYLSEAK